jgi:hypothetical protein
MARAIPLQAHTAHVIRLPVKPVQTRADRFWAKVDRSGGADACWPFTGSTAKYGYGQFSDISPITGRKTTRRAHRVAYELHNGSIPDGKNVLHTCKGSKSCCNPAHLYTGTQKQNAADAKRDGRLHGSALTPANVKVIVVLMAKGYGSDAMQERFGVSAQTIANIMGGRTWAHVTGLPRKPHDKGGRPAKTVSVPHDKRPWLKFPQSELFDVLDEAFNWQFADTFLGKEAAA